LNSRSSP